MAIPLWAIALVLAAIAPLASKMVADGLEKRARARSLRLLELGGAALKDDAPPVSSTRRSD